MSIRVVTELDAKGVQSGASTVKRSLDQVDAAMSRTENAADKTNAAMGRFGSRAGQAGIQIQQFVGQVQGGQSAMLALSQQSADLGIVLGAPLVGAIVGIGASIAGILLPNLFKSEDAFKKLEEASAAATAALEVDANGIFTISENTARLARENISLADSYLRVAQASAQAARAAADQKLKEDLDAIIDGQYGLGQAIFGTTKLTKEQRAEANELNKIYNKLYFGQQLTTEEAINTTAALKRLGEQEGVNVKNIIAFEKALGERNIEALRADELNTLLSQGYEKLIVSEKEAANAARIETEERKKLTAEKRKAAELDREIARIEFGTLSPVDQLRAEEQAKLDVIAEYATLGAEQARHAEQLKTDVMRQAAMERKELARIENQNTITAASNGFDALSQLSAAFIGDQDNQNKTAFALSKAFAVASAGLNLSLALSQALADPAALTLPQKLANMAAVASAGAGLISSVTSSNYATGGYVDGPGSGTSDSINANISRGEFVTRAAVTRKNRSALEYMNRTGEMPNGGGGVVINNYGSPDSVSVREEGGLTIVDIDERINKKVPGMIASEFRNPQSQANGAIRGQYQLQRR